MASALCEHSADGQSKKKLPKQRRGGVVFGNKNALIRRLNQDGAPSAAPRRSWIYGISTLELRIKAGTQEVNSLEGNLRY